MSGRHLTLLSALGISLLAPAASASAVPLPGQSQPGFGISPARQDVTGTPPLPLAPTTVLNGTTRTVRVTVFPVILTQDLTGAFRFSPAPRDLNAAKLVLTVGPTSFTLTPGQSQQVALRWNLLPMHQPWVVPGVVYQGIPEQQTGPVHVISRLLGISFLRLPGNYRIDGQFTGLFPEETAPRVLRFSARVKNTGEMFATPSAGKLVVRDSGGNAVVSEPWAGSVILPGASVDFPIPINQVLAAGHYTATVNMRFGGPRSLTVPFTLTGPNQLPTPAVTIRSFNASGVVGSPAKVTARIISDGTAPAGVTLHLFLGLASQVGTNAPALATGQASFTNLAPGRVVSLSRRLGRDLRKGRYLVIGTWTDATGAAHSLQAEFVTTPAQSTWSAIWSVLEPILIALLALGLLVLVAMLVRRMVERQRRLETELAAARARLRGEPPPPTPPAAAPVAEAEPVESEPEPVESWARTPVQTVEPAQPEPEPASEPEQPTAAEPEPVNDEPAPVELEPPPLRASAPPAEPSAEPEPVATPAASDSSSGPPPDAWIPPWERDQREP